jgi:hypothetical protein
LLKFPVLELEVEIAAEVRQPVPASLACASNLVHRRLEGDEMLHAASRLLQQQQVS